MEPFARPIGWRDTALVFFVVTAFMAIVCGLFGGCGSVQEAEAPGQGGAGGGGRRVIQAAAGGAGGGSAPGGTAGSISGDAGGGRGGIQVPGTGGNTGLGNGPGTGSGGSTGGAGGGAGAGGQGGAGGQCGSCSDDQICWHGFCACPPTNPGTGNISGGPCGNCRIATHYCPGACLPQGVDPTCD